AHPDPAVDGPDGQLDADPGHGLSPGQDVLIDAVDERPVEVEQECGPPRLQARARRRLGRGHARISVLEVGPRGGAAAPAARPSPCQPRAARATAGDPPSPASYAPGSEPACGRAGGASGFDRRHHRKDFAWNAVRFGIAERRRATMPVTWGQAKLVPV